MLNFWDGQSDFCYKQCQDPYEFTVLEESHLESFRDPDPYRWNNDM